MGPSGTLLPGDSIPLFSSGLLFNSTTGSNGIAFFPNLSSGRYTAAATVNGTYASLPIDFSQNETISIFFPVMSTSFWVSSSGSNSTLTLHGNMTASQLSNVQLKNANGVYSISFDVSGAAGTTGSATLTIPKSVIPGGLAPSVSINSAGPNNESFTQDSQNYYVDLSVPLGTSTNVSIQFSHAVGINLDLLILLVIIVAVSAAGLAVAIVRPKKRYSFGVP